ncbi:hypothetical protein [Halomonas faecis]|nr:hypothetical protein [Halomonas faecis]
MAVTPYKEWSLELAKGVPLKSLLFNQSIMGFRVEITLLSQGFYDREGFF